MKNLLLILAIIISSTVLSQPVQAYAMKIGDWNETKEGWDFREVDESDVTIDIKGDYLFFDNKINTVIRTFGDMREGENYVAWDALDDKGIDCSLMMYIDEEPYSIVIIYSSFCVVYYVTYN